MPNFNVRCIDRKSAKHYDLTVEASTATEAARVASETHVLAANHTPTRLPDPPPPPPPPPKVTALFDLEDRRFFRVIMHGVFWGVFGALIIYNILAKILGFILLNLFAE